jgi:hypothetical protein
MDVLLDGTPEAWLEFAQSRNLDPGGVLVVFGGRRHLERHVAAWHVVVRSAREDENSLSFTQVHHVTPPALSLRDVSSRLREELRLQFQAIGVPPADADAVAKRVRITEQLTNEGEGLLSYLQTVPAGSAIAVLTATTYRFRGVEKPASKSVPTWHVPQMNLTSRENLFFTHLMYLIERSLELAREKGLLVVLFCEDDGLVENSLPPQLQAAEELAVVSAHQSDEHRFILQQLPKWGRQVEAGEIEQALQEVDSQVQAPVDRALTKSHLLSIHGQFHVAWEILLPFLNTIRESDPSSLLSICQAALSAGNLDEAKTFLVAASEHSELSLEELKAAYLHATTLQLPDLAADFIARMQAAFPGHEITLALSFLYYRRKRDFSSALTIAEQLGYEFESRAIRAFQNPEFDLTEFFEFAHSTGEQDRAYNLAAHEALARNDHTLAAELARKVDLDSQPASDAMRVRIHALGVIVRASPGEPTGEMVVELGECIRFVSLRPDEVDLRAQLETLLEGGAEPLAMTAMLLAAFGDLLRRRLILIQSVQLDMTEFQIEQPLQPDQVEKFLETLAAATGSGGFVMGQGKLPPETVPMISSELLDQLLLMLQHGLRDLGIDELNWMYLTLHVITLISKDLKDPSSDMVALRLAIGGLANNGRAQEARNLAETALAYPQMQPAYYGWRTSQAWACYADAFHRTGNLPAAMRCLCLCLAAWEGPSLSKVLSASVLRLAARILRDMGLTEEAMACLAYERELITVADGDSQALVQLDQMALATQFRGLGDGATGAELLEMLASCHDLLERSGGREVAPILTLEAQLIRHLIANGEQPPQAVLERFHTVIQQLPEAVRITISALGTELPGKSDLLEAVQRLSNTLHSDDLAYQLRPVQVMARNAIRTAYQNQDIDLFLFATSLISQPALTQSAWHDSPPVSGTSAKARRWLAETVTRSRDPLVLTDSARVTQSVDAPVLKSLISLSLLTAGQVRDVLGLEELVVIPATTHSDELYQATIGKVGKPTIQILPSDTWSAVKYKLWQRQYPRAYGRWEPPSSPFENESPSYANILESVASLSLGFLPDANPLTVIPDSNLIAFPFNLITRGTSFYYETSPLSIAPSVAWLTETRGRPWQGSARRKTWLGSPSTSDYALHFLRDRLSSSLEQFGFEFIDADSPDGMEGCDVAIAVAHGGTGLLDHFRTVTDRVAAYSAEQFACEFADCGCVVLFICSAGRSDKAIWAEETAGVVSELLSQRVRVIVASPWPLSVYVPPLWLPIFLEGVNMGRPVASAAMYAAAAVRQVYKSPSAWAALHVYGDGELVLNTRNAGLSETASDL